MQGLGVESTPAAYLIALYGKCQRRGVLRNVQILCRVKIAGLADLVLACGRQLAQRDVIGEAPAALVPVIQAANGLASIDDIANKDFCSHIVDRYERAPTGIHG